MGVIMELGKNQKVLKRFKAAKKPVKIGVVAKINADVVGSAVCFRMKTCVSFFS